MLGRSPTGSLQRVFHYPAASIAKRLADIFDLGLLDQSVRDVEELHDEYDRQFDHALPRGRGRRRASDPSDFSIDSLRRTGHYNTHDDAEDGPPDDVGYVVEAEVDSAEGDKQGPREQHDTKLSVIGRKRRREGKGVRGVTTWKRGLGFWGYAQIARPRTCNGVLQSERDYIC